MLDSISLLLYGFGNTASLPVKHVKQDSKNYFGTKATSVISHSTTCYLSQESLIRLHSVFNPFLSLDLALHFGKSLSRYERSLLFRDAP